jgi:hypothetical protein
LTLLDKNIQKIVLWEARTYYLDKIMVKYFKRIIAPVIITICLIGYYIVYGTVIAKLNVPNIIKIVALVFSIIITIVTIMVLVERIKEIQRGEEDDLGKY